MASHQILVAQRQYRGRNAGRAVDDLKESPVTARSHDAAQLFPCQGCQAALKLLALPAKQGRVAVPAQRRNQFLDDSSGFAGAGVRIRQDGNAMPFGLDLKRLSHVTCLPV